MLLYKAFLGNTPFLHHLFHHLLREDQFIPLIEVSLQQAYCPQFMHEHISYNLFKEHCKPLTPSCQCHPIPGTDGEFCRMKEREIGTEGYCLIVTKMQATVGGASTLADKY